MVVRETRFLRAYNTTINMDVFERRRGDCRFLRGFGVGLADGIGCPLLRTSAVLHGRTSPPSSRAAADWRGTASKLIRVSPHRHRKSRGGQVRIAKACLVVLHSTYWYPYS